MNKRCCYEAEQMEMDFGDAIEEQLHLPDEKVDADALDADSSDLGASLMINEDET